MYTLSLENIVKTYPGVTALDNVSFDLRKGEILALCGENGAGKSTIIKIASGAVKPDSGFIVFEGERYSRMTPAQSRKLGIEVIYQELVLAPDLTVAENIFLGTKLNKSSFIDFKLLNQKAQKILDRLNITSFCATDKVGELRTASRQLVEIAKSLTHETKVLILDEPSAPLSVNEVKTLFNLLHNLKADGISIIYISHRLDEVFEVADRITVLRDGQDINTIETAKTDRKSLIQMMVGRKLNETYPIRTGKIGEVALEVKDICTKGVKHISFKVHKGEILGISGLVGAGRTELLSAIFGAQKKTSGEVIVKGEKVEINQPKDAIAKGIGLIPEDRKLCGLMLEHSISTNITFCALKRISKRTFIDKSAERAIVDEMTQKLRIKLSNPSFPSKTLSGGNQQKVVLAKWLAANVNVLFFDEPTRGIDVGTKQEIYELMNELTSQGIAIVMVSSEMDEQMGMTDRMIIMHEGSYISSLEKDEYSQTEILKYASGII
mgnify:CR=1 FL=1